MLGAYQIHEESCRQCLAEQGSSQRGVRQRLDVVAVELEHALHHPHEELHRLRPGRRQSVAHGRNRGPLMKHERTKVNRIRFHTGLLNRVKTWVVI